MPTQSPHPAREDAASLSNDNWSDGSIDDETMRRVLLKLKKRKHNEDKRSVAVSEAPAAPPGLPHPPAYRAPDTTVVGTPPPFDKRRRSPTVEEVEDVDAPPVKRHRQVRIGAVFNNSREGIGSGGAAVDEPVVTSLRRRLRSPVHTDLGRDGNIEPQVKRDPPLSCRSTIPSPVRHSRVPPGSAPASRNGLVRTGGDRETVDHIEISSSSEEDLANLPLSRGDSAYRGGRSQSRVDSVQAGRNISPPVTRRAARLRELTRSDTVPLQSSHDQVVDEDGHAKLGKPDLFLTLKPSPVIRSRSAANPFVDDEAEDAGSANSSNDSLMSVDKYDSDDSFIDDSDLKVQGRHRAKKAEAPALSPPPAPTNASESHKRTWATKMKNLLNRAMSPPHTPLARRKSSKSILAANAKVPSHKSSTARAKGKARATRPLSEDEGAIDFGDPDEIDYESFSEGELERLLEGVRRSRAARAAAVKQVDTSNHASSSTTQPPTTPISANTPPGASAPITPSPSQLTPGSQTEGSPHSPAGTRRCPPIPSVCKVTKADLQDPGLAGTYDNLVPLVAGELIPWTDLPGPGQVSFDAWREQCPDMDQGMAYKAVTFTEDGNFMNPSRSSPEHIEFIAQPGSTGRFYFGRYGQPIVAVSPVFLEQSQLLTPTTSGVIQKHVRGIFHSQEWERAVAWFCMGSGHPRLHAQLARDALQFSTRPRFDNKEGHKSKRKAMFTNTRSPSTGSNATPNKVSADSLTLPTDASVPVYDARSTNFNCQSDLPNLANLPVWHAEIPYGSFVIVGYTVSVYRSRTSKWTVGCNIQWAVIVGVPADDDEN